MNSTSSQSPSSVPPTVSQADVHRFISAPKTTFRQGVREKDRHRKRKRERCKNQQLREEIIARLTDYQWEILYVNKKENHLYRFIPRARIGFEGNVGANICDTHTSRTANY